MFLRELETLTGTHSNLESWSVSREVAVHALVRVADIPLVAWLSNLLGAGLAAAAAVQHGAHPRRTLGPLPTLTGPMAELPLLHRRHGSATSYRLCVVLSPAEALGDTRDTFAFGIPFVVNAHIYVLPKGTLTLQVPSCLSRDDKHRQLSMTGPDEHSTSWANAPQEFLFVYVKQP